MNKDHETIYTFMKLFVLNLSCITKDQKNNQESKYFLKNHENNIVINSKLNRCKNIKGKHKPCYFFFLFNLLCENLFIKYLSVIVLKWVCTFQVNFTN